MNLPTPPASYRVFTITSGGYIQPGAALVRTKSGGAVIRIGEVGRARSVARLSVECPPQETPCPERGKEFGRVHQYSTAGACAVCATPVEYFGDELCGHRKSRHADGGFALGQLHAAAVQQGPRLMATPEPSSSEKALVVVRATLSMHREAHNTIDGSFQTLAEGFIARGAAGRLGNGSQQIVLLNKGETITVGHHAPGWRSDVRSYTMMGEELV